MNGGTKNPQQYQFGMDFLEQVDAYGGLDGQDFLFAGMDPASQALYAGITPPISPPTSTMNSQSQGMPASTMYGTAEPYIAPHGNARNSMTSIPSIPAASDSNDMLDFISPNGGFGSEVSPMMNTAGEFDESFGGNFDESYGWDMSGVMMGDGAIGDGLDGVFNDPLNEALLDPLQDESFNDEMHDSGKSGAEGETSNNGKHAAEEGAEPTGPKKRGRKRITSEPSSKRKAQNRAAQRAFRERKEKHVKDLEVKVAELEKASENANSENSMLRAKVDHLSNELKQYRRRLHSISRANMIMTGGIGGPAAPVPTAQPWQFEFPDTWRKPGHGRSPATPDSSKADGLMTRQRSEAAEVAASPGNTDMSALGLRHDSSASERADSQVDSPNTSIDSHHPTSSCATSPEPSALQPLTPPASNTNETVHHKTPNGEEYVCATGADGETTFCEKLGMLACGNPNNPLEKVPDLDHIQKLKQKALEQMRARRGSATPAASKFDPSFGTYRDPIEKISKEVSERPEPGDAVFGLDPTWGFGNKKSRPRELLDLDDDDFDSGAPTEKMMTCNKIWDRIAHHPSFKSGELDVDSLCSELRQKAKCSEGGVVVGEKTVEKAIKKLEREHSSRKASPAAPSPKCPEASKA